MRYKKDSTGKVNRDMKPDIVFANCKTVPLKNCPNWELCCMTDSDVITQFHRDRVLGVMQQEKNGLKMLSAFKYLRYIRNRLYQSPEYRYMVVLVESYKYNVTTCDQEGT
jgi:hypothetical protein